jgi:hypothetical protein
LEHLKDVSFLGKLLVFPPNLRPDWKVIASYKHSGLFGFIDSDEGKKFYNIVPEEKVINLFMVVIYVFHNKLEHLSLAN